MSSIQDTIEWCKFCSFCDDTKPLTNCGGECCTIKKKRTYGKACKWWLRRAEDWDDPWKKEWIK